MNIIFMGTPDFAVPSLSKIFHSRHKISAVVTAPDKERGRGQKISYTPVKEFALENHIPLLQPVKLKDTGFIEELSKYHADLFVVVAFKILPPEVFALPAKGSFNLHASLLPKYRGAAPIQWAVINGEKETGVTTFALEQVVDTGNIYIQRKIEIKEEDNLGTVHDRLSFLGADAVLETIDMIESGEYKLLPQDNSLATPAPKITKETGRIDWQNGAEKIHNLIRGLSPYPGAYFINKQKLFKVYKSEIIEENLNAGEFKQGKDFLYIGTSDKVISIKEIQQEGRKKMNISDFLRGYSFQ